MPVDNGEDSPFPTFDQACHNLTVKLMTSRFARENE
jgi:hypothetical protein